jgi:hypothetical protein
MDFRFLKIFSCPVVAPFFPTLIESVLPNDTLGPYWYL